MSLNTEILADAPRGYWRMGDTSGTTAASAGTTSAPGTYTGGFTLNQTGLDGSVDKAVLFDGSTGYVDIGDIFDLGIEGPITLECIVKVHSFPSGDGDIVTFLGKGYDGAQVGYDFGLIFEDGEVKLIAGSYMLAGNIGYNVRVAVPWSVDETHHIVALYNGTHWKLYIGGALAASAAKAVGALHTDSPVMIAAEDFSGVPSRFANATIDECAIYAGALTDERILAHATAAGLAASTPALDSLAVSDSGNTVLVALDSPTAGSILAEDFDLRINGNPHAIHSIDNDFSSLGLAIGHRWITEDDVVTLSYTGDAFAPFTDEIATNNSTVTAHAKRTVGRERGMGVCFGMPTYYPDAENQWCDGTEDIDVFDPTDYDMDQWVACAKAFGARFVSITSKHVDGFALWVTSTTARGIKDTTWYASNPIDIYGEFCTKFRAAGMAIQLYFSVWDRKWEIDNPTGTDAEYTAFTISQLTELLTRYGKVDCLVFDAWQSTPEMPDFTRVDKDEVLALCHALQPDMTIMINTFGTYPPPLPAGAEITIWEYPVHGAVDAGRRDPGMQWDVIQFNPESGSITWFWNPDCTVRPASELLDSMENAIANNAYFLLECPPDMTGKIPEDYFRTMSEIGQPVFEPALSPPGNSNKLVPGFIAA